MTTKTFAPTPSLAMGCTCGKADKQTMSCAAGTTYDTTSNTCLPTTG